MESENRNAGSRSAAALEVKMDDDQNLATKNSMGIQLLHNVSESSENLNTGVVTPSVLECESETERLCSETNDSCQMTEDNNIVENLFKGNENHCTNSILDSEASVVTNESDVERENTRDSDLTGNQAFLQHDVQHIVPSNLGNSRTTNLDVLNDIGKANSSVHSENNEVCMNNSLEFQGLDKGKSNDERKNSVTISQVPLIDSCIETCTSNDSLDCRDKLVDIKDENLNVVDLNLNDNPEKSNKNELDGICGINPEMETVKSSLSNGENAVKDFLFSDPKHELTLGQLITNSNQENISPPISGNCCSSSHKEENVSDSPCAGEVPGTDPLLDVHYLRDDSIDEYSSKEPATSSIVDQLSSTSSLQNDIRPGVISNGKNLQEILVDHLDEVALSPSVSTAKKSLPHESNLDNSCIQTRQAEEGVFSSEINNEDPRSSAKSDMILQDKTTSTKLEETTVTKKEAFVKPEATSLKQSVFRVFRDVARSVNKEQVNEALNENIKQVYRNVWKNVASENFPGQNFMNKFQSDAIKKSSSKEELTPSEVIQKNSNVCESSENLATFQPLTPYSNDSKFKQEACSVGSSTSNINSDSTQCGSQLSLTTLGVENEGELQKKLDPFCNETLATSLSQYMYRASLSDLRLKASPPTSNTDTLTREYQSDLNVNQRENCSDGRISSVSCNEHNSSSMLSYKSSESRETEGDGKLVPSTTLENSTDTDLESGKQTPQRDSSSKILMEDLCAITCQSINLVDKILSPLIDFETSSEDTERKRNVETETIVNAFDIPVCKLQLQNLQEKQLKAQDMCKSLASEVERLEAAASPALYQTQLAALEEELQKCQSEAGRQKQELQEQHQLQLEQQISARAALTEKLERLTKLYNDANANKEAMVVKYAVAEKNVLVAQKQRDVAEKKCRDLEKDKDVLLARVKNISAEKTRITSILDKKISECSSAGRDIERLKEDLSAKDVKIKWTQAKLTAEMEAHKAVQARLDAAEAQISSVRQEAADTVQEARMDETSRANVLDKEVAEHKSRLIVEESCVRQLREELAAAKSKIAALAPQNASLLSQVTSLKQQLDTASGEREESEALFKSLQQQLHASQQHSTALQHALDQLPLVRQQLQEVTSELETQKETLKSSEQRCAEHSSELELLRSKEAELLSFTQLLSETNSRVQSELNTLAEAERQWGEEKQKLEADVQHWRQACSEVKLQLTSQLTEARSRLDTVCSELEQQSAATQRLLQRVAELEGDLTLERKRHANLVKDLNRELQKLRRKADGDAASSDKESKKNGLTVLQNSTPGVGGEVRDAGVADKSKAVAAATSNTSSSTSQDNLSLNSRTSSQTSLNESGSAAAGQTQQTILVPDMRASNEMLVQRIVKLQKSLARRTEKEEFYEEHVAQLVAELQKKNRIIDYFVMKEEVGTMPDNRADAAKLSKKGKAVQLHKARMMQQKGIMSSIYGSQQKDEAMTLELSLEINRKLQALFEDTLLKNITLKESLSTLGDEVARLSLHANRRQ